MTKPYYYKGRIVNLLLRSHEEMRTLTHPDNDQLLDKNSTVYGETKMIEIEKNYKLTLTEQQAKELYQLLRTEKDSGCLTPDKELKLVYHELKDLI
jgi:plasmid replication initiation protein